MSATAQLGRAVLGPYIDDDVPTCATAGCRFFPNGGKALCSLCSRGEAPSAVFNIGLERVSEEYIVKDVEASSALLHTSVVDGICYLLKERLPAGTALLDTSWWTATTGASDMQRRAARAVSSGRFNGVAHVLCLVWGRNHYQLLKVDVAARLITVYDSLMTVLPIPELQMSQFQAYLNIVFPDERPWKQWHGPCGKQLTASRAACSRSHHARVLLRGLPLAEPNVPSSLDEVQQRKELQLIRHQIGREMRRNALEDGLALVDFSVP